MTTRKQYIGEDNKFMVMLRIIESNGWDYVGEYPYQEGHYGFRLANRRNFFGDNNQTKESWQKICQELREALGHHVHFGQGHAQYAPEQKRFAVFIKSKAQAAREWAAMRGNRIYGGGA